MRYDLKQGLQYVVVGTGLLLPMSGCKANAGPDDATANAAVQSRLQADPGLAGQSVQASVQNGVATLSGTVGNEAARSLAASDVAAVKGIRTVVNNLAVAPPSASVNGPAGELASASPRNASTPRQVERAPRLDSRGGVAPAPIDVRQPAPSPSAQQTPPSPSQPPRPSAPVFRDVTVPSGTGLSVRITQTLDSAATQPGSTFSGVLASDVVVDGAVAFPAGARVNGRVDDAKDAGHFSGNSLLAITLTGISRRGEDTAISTDTFSKQGKGRGKNTAEKVGGGAAVGAILGGIFGGGKGAAIGAGAGGGLGAGANGVTRGEQVTIPSESIVRFRLTSPLSVRIATQSENPSSSGDLRRHE